MGRSSLEWLCFFIAVVRRSSSLAAHLHISHGTALPRPRGSPGSAFPTCRRPGQRIWRVCTASSAGSADRTRPRSAENGNMSNIRERLSAISLCSCHNWEPGDETLIWKSRHWRAFLGLMNEQSIAVLPWLATQWNSRDWQFPDAFACGVVDGVRHGDADASNANLANAPRSQRAVVAPISPP